MEINFEDWRKENPNGSLNDFYSSARKNNNAIVSYPFVEKVIVYEPANIDSQQKLKVQQSIVIGITASLLCGIGFFAPWFSIPIFNLSISGNEISQLANLMAKYSETEINISLINYIYIIPITSALLLVGNLVKSYALTSISGIINLFFVGFVIGFIINEIPNAVSLMSFGLYMIITSWFLLLYFLITNKL